MFGTVVKLPFGVPASHIAVSGFVFCSTSASSFPVVQALREQVVTWGMQVIPATPGGPGFALGPADGCKFGQ